MASFFSMIGCATCDKISKEAHFAYDKQNHMLLVGSTGSAKYVKLIELDLQQDTLVVRKAHIKLKPIFNKSFRKEADFAIKLESNVEFVKIGHKTYKVSEISKYSIMAGFPTLIIIPQRFPCIIK